MYRAQLDNGISGLAALSEKMASLYLRWLDEQCRLNGVLPSTAPAVGR
jgi:hypothetical protein